jgi:hypothetical protein
MTRGTSGPSSPTAFALFDRESSSWKTSPTTSTSGSETYLGTWPRWGMTRRGESFALPRPEPRTNEQGSTSLLGTPRCADGMKNRLRSGVSNPRGRLEDQIAILEEPTSFFPTLTGNLGSNGGPQPREKRKAGGHTVSLEDVCAFLPTPRASDGEKGGPNQRGSKGDPMLPAVVHRLSTGSSTPQPSGDGSGF